MSAPSIKPEAIIGSGKQHAKICAVPLTTTMSACRVRNTHRRVEATDKVRGLRGYQRLWPLLKLNEKVGGGVVQPGM
jgi:hypothetical protein